MKMEILIIVLIVFYIAIFYFLKMRPEKQRKKEQEEMKRSLNPMIDGIVGNVCAVKEKTIVIETGADRVRLEYATWAIMNKGAAVDQAAN